MSERIEVKVVGRKAKFLPGVGERQPGESFYLPEQQANDLRSNPDFEVVSQPETKTSEVTSD